MQPMEECSSVCYRMMLKCCKIIRPSSIISTIIVEIESFESGVSADRRCASSIGKYRVLCVLMYDDSSDAFVKREVTTTYT